MPTNLPLFPLGTVLFPGMPMPLQIFEPRFLQLMDDHREEEIPFGVSLILNARSPERDWPAHAIGTAAMLTEKRQRSDGQWEVVVKGQRRYRTLSCDYSRPYAVATIEWLDEPLGDPTEADTLLKIVATQFHRYVGGITRLTHQSFGGVAVPEDPVRASYDLASRLPLHTWERQRLLEAATTVERLSEISMFVERELALLLRAGTAGLALNHPGGMFSLN